MSSDFNPFENLSIYLEHHVMQNERHAIDLGQQLMAEWLNIGVGIIYRFFFLIYLFIFIAWVQFSVRYSEKIYGHPLFLQFVIELLKRNLVCTVKTIKWLNIAYVLCGVNKYKFIE